MVHLRHWLSGSVAACVVSGSLVSSAHREDRFTHAVAVCPVLPVEVEDPEIEVAFVFINIGHAKRYRLPTDAEMPTFRNLEVEVDGRPAAFVFEYPKEADPKRSRMLMVKPDEVYRFRLRLSAVFKIDPGWQEISVRPLRMIPGRAVLSGAVIFKKPRSKPRELAPSPGGNTGVGGVAKNGPDARDHAAQAPEPESPLDRRRPPDTSQEGPILRRQSSRDVVGLRTSGNAEHGVSKPAAEVLPATRTCMQSAPKNVAPPRDAAPTNGAALPWEYAGISLMIGAAIGGACVWILLRRRLSD